MLYTWCLFFGHNDDGSVHDGHTYYNDVCNIIYADLTESFGADVPLRGTLSATKINKIHSSVVNKFGWLWTVSISNVNFTFITVITANLWSLKPKQMARNWKLGGRLIISWIETFLSPNINASIEKNMSVFKSTEPIYVKSLLVKILLYTVLRTAFLWSYIHVNSSNVSKTYHMINRYFDVFCSNFPHHMTRMQIYQAPLQDFCSIKGTIATSSFPRDGITITADTRGIMGIITTPREVSPWGLEAWKPTLPATDPETRQAPISQLYWWRCHDSLNYVIILNIRVLTPQWVSI